MSSIKLKRLDHLVLTTSREDEIISFYTSILGCELVIFGENRKALRFGHQKINLHALKAPLKPHAKHPTVGCLDLCFLIEGSLQEAIKHLKEHAISYEGPFEKTGAIGPIESIYIRDPDQNLIELSCLS